MFPNYNERLLRLNQIVGKDGPLPISKSTWWDGVASGRYPAPVKLGPRISAWRLSDIDNIIENGALSVEGQSNG